MGIFGQRYAHISRGTHRVKEEVLHYSGDSDSSGSNGDLNVLAALTAIGEHFNISEDDESLMVLVEGMLSC